MEIISFIYVCGEVLKMAYTVENLLDKFPEIKLISGSEGINKQIKGIRIVEVTNMEKFLNGGELLLTSLKAYEDIGERDFLKYLEELERKRISGFVVKRNLKTEQQKKLFDFLLWFSEAYQIPVLQLSLDMHYWMIIKYVLSQIYNTETAKLTYFKITHDNLSDLMLRIIDARKSLKKTIFMVTAMLGNPVALCNGEFTCLLSSHPGISSFSLAENYAEYIPDIITRYQYLYQKRENVEYIKKLDVFGRRDLYLIVTEQNEPLTELDFIALENIIITLQYIIMRIMEEEDIARRYHRDLLYRLLYGSLTSLEENEVAKILKLNVEDEFRVVTFQLIPKNQKGKFTNEQIRETEIVERELLRFLPEKYIVFNTNEIIYIHKQCNMEDQLQFRIELETLQQSVQNKLIQSSVESEFLVGIGEIVKSYHCLKNSFEGAKMALEYIDIIRKIIGDTNKSVVDFSKLGFIRMFMKTKNKDELWTYIPKSLHKLYEYDVQKNAELIDTLECFLNQNQSFKKTSQVMFVHYRTITYRIQKIKEISGMDFGNVTEMLTVRNGLIMLKFIEGL